MSEPIEHVSDTAFWVASYRGQEGERPDAAFQDPLAARLAGDKGRKIAEAMPDHRAMAFIMPVRTTAIDRLVLTALERGVDTVLNLGAGLDTRPYRLALPASLRWIEADFPSIIEYKNEQLANEQPACQLERVALDLADRGARQALFTRVGGDARGVLVITEGVIIYLPDDEVGRLAEDVRDVPHFRYWIQDYYGIEARRHRPNVRRRLQAAPFLFGAPDWFGFFEKFGLFPAETISTRTEARRIGRRPPLFSMMTLLMLTLSAKWQERADAILGYTMLERRTA